jgi:hypothetical protein
MKIKIIPLLFVATIALAGCSSAKDKLGLTKKSPDEFAVVKRAPLSMPPNYTLRPPSPGAPRPQEQSPEQAARQTVFGAEGQAAYEAQATGNDATFLNKAGAAKADPSIRRKIDSETAVLNEQEKPVVKRLLGMDSPEQAPANVVNAKEEAARLKSNKEKGKPVTEGETPSVEQ